ncbi:MAG: hypothetical protein ABI852_09910 [Gemmatimonadaceae bacterium]
MRRLFVSAFASLCVNAIVSSVTGAQAAAPARSTHPVMVTKTVYRVNPMTVFEALAATWRSAGIKSPTVDAPNFTMSYVIKPAPLKIGNTAIERVADCGGDKKSPLAKTTPLVLMVKSEVKRTEEGAELSTTLEVFPTDSTSTVVCLSTQVLEKKFEPNIVTSLMKGGSH